MTLRPLAFAASAALCLMGAAAQAAPFTIQFGSATGPDGTVNFTLSGDTQLSKASLKYSEDEEGLGPDPFFYFVGFDDPDANLAIGPRTTSSDADGTTTQAIFTVGNPDKTYTETSDNPAFTPKDLRGYSISFRLSEIVYNDVTRPAEYLIDRTSLVLYGPTALSAPSVTVTGFPLSSVPLPSSLPLFGAGVLALVLGAAGTRRSRKALAVAA